MPVVKLSIGRILIPFDKGIKTSENPLIKQGCLAALSRGGYTIDQDATDPRRLPLLVKAGFRLKRRGFPGSDRGDPSPTLTLGQPKSAQWHRALKRARPPPPTQNACGFPSPHHECFGWQTKFPRDGNHPHENPGDQRISSGNQNVVQLNPTPKEILPPRPRSMKAPIHRLIHF